MLQGDDAERWAHQQDHPSPRYPFTDGCDIDPNQYSPAKYEVRALGAYEKQRARLITEHIEYLKKTIKQESTGLAV